MKKLLALILVVATLFCVAACGDKKDTTTTTRKKDSTVTTTVADETTTAAGTEETTAAGTEETTAAGTEETTAAGTEETTTAATEVTTTTTAPTTTTKPPRPDANDKNNWDKVVNSVFTASNGGLQMDADGWKTFTMNTQLSMVPTAYKNDGYTNAICLKVYDPDSEEVFNAKTEEDFEAVLLGDITSFTKITVDGYPAYYAIIPDQMYCYVVNTPNAKYFINFMQAAAPYGSPIEQTAKAMMATVQIYK